MKFPLLALTVVSLTGCTTTMSAAECQNPYDVGFLDAIFGLQPQDTLYASACSTHGVQLNTARYSEGWQEGKYEYDRRKGHGGVD